MRKLNTLIKLKYLSTKNDIETLCKAIRASRIVLENALDTGTHLLKDPAIGRINEMFMQQIQDDVEYYVYKNYKPKSRSIKNYDDDESLTDLKTYNSKHGVNKGSRAFSGHSN